MPHCSLLILRRSSLKKRLVFALRSSEACYSQPLKSPKTEVHKPKLQNPDPTAHSAINMLNLHFLQSSDQLSRHSSFRSWAVGTNGDRTHIYESSRLASFGATPWNVFLPACFGIQVPKHLVEAGQCTKTSTKTPAQFQESSRELGVALGFRAPC